MNVSKWKKAFTEKDTQLSIKKKRFIKILNLNGKQISK